jgi:hypothetical protein
MLTTLEAMLQDRDREKVERITDTFSKMKKHGVGELKRASKGVLSRRKQHDKSKHIPQLCRQH